MCHHGNLCFIYSSWFISQLLGVNLKRLLVGLIFSPSFFMKWMHFEVGKQLETLLTFTEMRHSWLPEMKWPTACHISSIPFPPHLKYLMGLMPYYFSKYISLRGRFATTLPIPPPPISFLPLAQTHQMQLFLGASWNVTLWAMSKDSGTKLSGSFQGCHTVQ